METFRRTHIRGGRVRTKIKRTDLLYGGQVDAVLRRFLEPAMTR